MIKRLVKNNVRTAEIAVAGGHYAAASGIAMFQRERPFLRNRIQLFSPKLPLSELVESLNEYQPAFLIVELPTQTILAYTYRYYPVHHPPSGTDFRRTGF